MPGMSTFGAVPSHLIAPFGIANSYGFFGVMTEARYEIEFLGPFMPVAVR